MRPVLLIAAGVSMLALASGCRGQTSEDAPILIARNMWDSPRYNAQARSSYFSDHRVMRTPPAGTVAREGYSEDDEYALGRTADGAGYVATIPASASAQFANADDMLHRGQDRYNIYCTPCHGRTGDGNGIVPRRASVTGYQFPQPPTFHADPASNDRIRHIPDGQLYATITNGVRNMPSYASQIPVADRWAIVAYVRALQLSQGTNPTATARAQTTEPAQ